METGEILYKKQLNINSLETQVVHLKKEPLGNFDDYEFKIEHSRSVRINVTFRFVSDEGYISGDYEQTDIESLVPFYINADNADADKVYTKIELEGNYNPHVPILLSIKKIPVNVIAPKGEDLSQG